MAGIELLALRMARRIREHNEEVDRINNMSNPTPAPTPKPRRDISLWTALSLGMLVLCAFFVLVGVLTGLWPMFAFSGVTGFAAVTFAVLSLRERV